MKLRFLLILLAITLFTINSQAQFKNYGMKGGIQFQALLPFSEFDARASFLGRGFLNFELTNSLSIDLGAAYGQYKTDDHYNTYPANSPGDHDITTDIIPVDIRLRISPVKKPKNWNPYFFIGGGFMYYNVKNVPDDSTITAYNVKESGWTGIVPVGLGTEVKLSNSVLLDINGGATYTFTDLLNNFVIPDYKDAYAHLGIGLTFAGSDRCNTDEDKDGLTYCREEQLKTDPLNPDTDGDGCKDGAEVDQYKTNPLNPDTDGDTLNDCDEIMKYSTNPLSKDTDADNLTDNDELQKYMTLPTDKDTDDDGLTDGDEVLTYKTNPKMIDTDLGSINDGVEVKRGTDPLNPNDDLPPVPKEEIVVGTVIILDGVNFASGSADLSAGSEAVLDKALATMKNNPEIFVEISGHTDSRGGREMNMNLSKNRAESVKEYLVSNGIDAIRIETIGYGPDQPIASNDTEEGRLQNRRIEFKRTK